MITLHLEKKEMWDEVNEEFVYVGPNEPTDINLEHSLVSISKWEAKYHKPYLDTKDKTPEETLDYISMMVIGKSVDPKIFYALSGEQIKEIADYIENPMTATVIKDEKKDNSKGEEFTTSELIYYWMTAMNIPFECQYWHINRLITLVRICAIKNNPDKNKKKKLTSSDLAVRRAEMQARRAKYHTNG